MKHVLYFLSALVLFVSCEKEKSLPEDNSIGKIHKVFTANTVGTKTSLDGDGVTMKWAESDEINVIARTTGNQYTFMIKDGDEGKTTATFEGDILAADSEETVFYAVYPNVNAQINKGSDPDKDIIEYLGSAVTGHRKYFNSASDPVNAVKDGFDGRFAPMTAKLSGDEFSFRHGAAYFKLTMGTTGVKTIKLSASGSARFNGRPKYNVSDGSTSTVESAQNNISIEPSAGTFDNGGVYYIPVLTKQSTVGTLTIRYTLEDGTTYSEVTTTSLGSAKLASGKIYDLKTPPVAFAPSITTSNVNISKDATGGNIAFTIAHPAGDGVISIAETGGETNPVDFVLNTTLQTDHFEFTCDANDNPSPRTFYVTLTYSYNSGADEVTKDIEIIQAGAAIHKDWNFSSSAWQTALTSSAASAQDTDQKNWSVSNDDLTYTAGNANSKWSTTYIQPGGAGSESQRYFSFTAPVAGTITVYVINPKSSENLESTRVVNVKVGTGAVQTSSSILYGATEERSFTISAGAVKIYPGGNGLRFTRIKYDTE